MRRQKPKRTVGWAMAEQQTQLDIVLDRTNSMRKYMLGGIKLIDRVIHEVEAKGGPMGPLFGYEGIQRDLLIIRKRYASIYKEEFKSLDDKSLANFGCLGVLDLFESDLLSRLKTTRERMWAKYAKVLEKIKTLNDTVANTAEVSAASNAVKDPTLRRYLDQTTRDSDLIASLDQDAADWRTNNVTLYKKKAPSDAFDALFTGDSHKPGYAMRAVDALSRWQDSILNAQYPLSSHFCSESAPVSSSLEEKAAEERKQQADARSKEQTERQKAFMSSSTDLSERIKGIVRECQELINKVDSSYFDSRRGTWVAPKRELANSLRSELATIEGQVPVVAKTEGSEYSSRSEALLSRANSLLQRARDAASSKS